METWHSQEEKFQLSHILMDLRLVRNILMKLGCEYNLVLHQGLCPEYLPPDTVNVKETL